MSCEITGRTRLGGLLGSPVAHSISPLMHNESFRMLDLDFVYLCFDLKEDDLPVTVDALRRMNTFGFNLTMPLKTAILPLLDEISPAAKLCRAVNTVVCEGGKLRGYNTDGSGFFRALEEIGFDPAGQAITVLGFGGAARAILAQAVVLGASRLFVACRRGPSRPELQQEALRLQSAGRTDVRLIALEDPDALADAVSQSALLANATSVGMEPDTDRSPLPDPAILRPGLLVGDVIYHPRTTRLLQEAAARGCITAEGRGMLLWQGAEAFSLWTGRQMPVEHIRRRFFSA